MCCRSILKRIFPFAFTLIISLLAVNFLQKGNLKVKVQENSNILIKDVSQEKGIGCGECSVRAKVRDDFENFFYSKPPAVVSKTVNAPFKILSKPRANFTEIARQNLTTGTVRIRAAFLASGQIGNVYPISKLPDGLTEQAVEAATQIKFQPEIRNGKPVSVTKVIEYSFNIY